MRKTWLSTLEVICKIKDALDEKKPLSIVRVGDGENICLTQYKVWPIKRTLATRWAKLSRRSDQKGVRLPNKELLKKLVKSLKRADIVGIPYYNDPEIHADQMYLRTLTDEVFEKHDIRPNLLCHTFVNRHMVEYPEFWGMLRGKRVAFISRWGKDFRKLVNNQYSELDIQFVKVIRMKNFKKIPKVIRQMEKVNCDIVFISAGVNAVILAQKLAEEQNRVAIDFGKAAAFMLTGDSRVKPWKPETMEISLKQK